jgi:hypothetical protein
MTSTSLAFQLSGNASVITAGVGTETTQLVIQPSGTTPGAFYVYNSADQVAFVNITTNATANVAIATGNQDGRGFPVFRYAPVLINLNQGFDYSPGNIYITAATTAGSADVYITPIA